MRTLTHFTVTRSDGSRTRVDLIEFSPSGDMTATKEMFYGVTVTKDNQSTYTHLREEVPARKLFERLQEEFC